MRRRATSCRYRRASGGGGGGGALWGAGGGPLSLVGGDLLDVSGVLDAAAPVEAAVVAGDLDTVGEDAHGRVAGADHHALADVGGGARVAVCGGGHGGLPAGRGP